MGRAKNTGSSYPKKSGRSLANRCFLCDEGEEIVDHLLIHCSKAIILWDLLLAIYGVSWVFPLSVKETLLFLGKVCLLESGVRRHGWLPHSVFLGLYGGRETDLCLRVWIFQSIV